MSGIGPSRQGPHLDPERLGSVGEQRDAFLDPLLAGLVGLGEKAAVLPVDRDHHVDVALLHSQTSKAVPLERERIGLSRARGDLPLQGRSGPDLLGRSARWQEEEDPEEQSFNKHPLDVDYPFVPVIVPMSVGCGGSTGYVLFEKLGLTSAVLSALNWSVKV